MRGDDQQPEPIFSYVSAEERIPKDHPLRAIRALVDEILREISRDFTRLYAATGRPSVPPERLLRAQLLQNFYSIRSERLLMEAPVQHSLSLVCRPVDGRCRLHADGVHQEPRPPPERHDRGALLHAGRGEGAAIYV